MLHTRKKTTKGVETHVHESFIYDIKGHNLILSTVIKTTRKEFLRGQIVVNFRE